MNIRFENELSEPLAALVRNTDDASPAAAEHAQSRLLTRLQGNRHPARAPSRTWLALAGTATIALLLIVLGPRLSGGGDAFAAALEHFRHFDTLAMSITQRFNGQVVQMSRTVVNAQGVLRTDIGKQLSIISDPTRGRVLMLMHDSKEAVLMPIPKVQGARGDDMKWLQQVRAFKGKATPLSTTRVINGINARGWALDLPGNRMELWADANGMPVAMRQQGGGGLEIDYRFEFDQPIEAGLLSSEPPKGYVRVESDGD
jgi:hypothetical protein